MNPIRFIPMLAVLLAAPSWSAPPLASRPPTVIHDAGGMPLAPYFEPFADDVGEAAPAPQMPAQLQPPQLFPVVSTRAGPGRLLQNPMPSKLPGGPGQPIFIVGDDPASLEWLQRNADALRRMGARGIVASVGTREDFLRLRASADLHMVPMSADALLEAAGIHVWPVLIGADGAISQ
ncbi:PFL_4695 family integrating conjugative element protein [Aromatoleum petrolei]|uniref:Integrating conjugative element protein n=1 Tax=Aromatoleum petrolei TaxID=76116 RepID=A0ABX1MW15_9RHOO|nr:integrating conjugative element protein [Aromatoleum petrolei]NMF91431.1 integrating conjugative element protein [Aromatoleum petrolei]